MTTAYGIRVIHSDRPDDVRLLRKAVAREIGTLGLHRSVTVVVSEDTPKDDAPYVSVFLGSAQAKSSADAIAQATVDLSAGITVFPVVADLDNLNAWVPNILSRANGMVWTDEVGLAHLVRVLLEDLGIEDRQRKVFISHRRQDGLAAAEQLHDRLTHFGFQPFIDRFAIREGADFQQEIANALEDHAFLFLLETPLAHTSDWVYDEIDYALSHTMGILIASWPGDVQEVPGSPGLPRVRLAAGDLVRDSHDFDTFTEDCLDRLVASVEAAHASGLVRRRKMLIGSIEESARGAGVLSCVPLRDWRLLVETSDGIRVIGTSPRLPNAADLQGVDEASARVGASLPGLLVHSARVIPNSLKQHLNWVSGSRELGMIPENSVGGWWSSAG